MAHTILVEALFVSFKSELGYPSLGLSYFALFQY